MITVGSSFEGGMRGGVALWGEQRHVAVSRALGKRACRLCWERAVWRGYQKATALRSCCVAVVSVLFRVLR